jgi:hypothetical protein
VGSDIGASRAFAQKVILVDARQTIRGESNENLMESSKAIPTRFCAIDFSSDSACPTLRARKLGIRCFSAHQRGWHDGNHRCESEKFLGAGARCGESVVGEQ